MDISAEVNIWKTDVCFAGQPLPFWLLESNTSTGLD